MRLPVDPDFSAVVGALRAQGWTYARIVTAVELQGVGVTYWAVRDIALRQTRVPNYALGAALLNLLEPTHKTLSAVGAPSGEPWSAAPPCKG